MKNSNNADSCENGILRLSPACIYKHESKGESKKLSLFLILASQLAFANFSTFANQKSFVENHAKKARRDMWVNGYRDVQTSPPEKVTSKKMAEFYKENSTYANPLDRSDFSQLYSCLNSVSCALWFYESSSSMYGGSGSARHYVLLYINSNRSDSIDHAIYEE